MQESKSPIRYSRAAISHFKRLLFLSLLTALSACVSGGASLPSSEEPPGPGEYKLTMTARGGSMAGETQVGKLTLFPAKQDDRGKSGELVQDLDDELLAWGYTDIEADALGIPVCYAAPLDSDDPISPGVVLVGTRRSKSGFALLLATTHNKRDGTVSFDGCGVGLWISKWDGEEGRGSWNEFGTVVDGSGTFRFELIGDEPGAGS